MKISWRDSPAELERLRLVQTCVQRDLLRAQRVHPVTPESIAIKKQLESEWDGTVAKIDALEQVVLEAKRAFRWENGGQR